MLRRLSVALVLGLGLVARDTQAVALGKECRNNSDCTDPDATCVAGSSEYPIQRCVQGKACGGASLGSCPGDEKSGQLVCVWLQSDETCSGASDGCKAFDGAYGIYKCVSMDRCEENFPNLCKDSCNVGGEQCNGRGNCQATRGGEKPKFECSCDSGWDGDMCDNVVNATCVEGVGQCGKHGECVENECECSDGYSGDQCEIPPSDSMSGSTDLSMSNSEDASVSASDSESDSDTIDGSTKSNRKEDADSAGNAAEDDDSNSTIYIIIGIIAGIVVLAALIFAAVVWRRRKHQETDEGAAAFGRSSSVDGLEGPETPKEGIVTM